MHRSFAAWLLGPSERIALPWRAAAVTACFGALSPLGLSPFAVFAGAIPVLFILRGNAAGALSIIATGSIAQATVLLAARQPLSLVLLFIALLYLAPAGLGVVLVRYGSLNLCFQLAVLVSAMVLIGVHMVLAQPAAVWEHALHEMVNSLTTAGIKVDENSVVSSLAQSMWGSCVALWLLTALSALFMARWWQSQLESPGGFGREFRDIHVGVILGVAATAVLAGALLTNWPVIDACAWVAMSALAFQGLAAAHRCKVNGRLTRGWLAAVYVLLIIPLSAFVMVLVLAVWGFVDNFLKLKARAA
jgi:hypothetical protein